MFGTYSVNILPHDSLKQNVGIISVTYANDMDVTFPHDYTTQNEFGVLYIESIEIEVTESQERSTHIP